MASASDCGWQSNDKGQPVRSLLLELRQRSYVLPWSLFLFAEGTDAEVRLVFHTHLIRIEGSGLTSLLSDLAEQAVEHIMEPDHTARFQPVRGSHIIAVSIAENK